jgi:hypothetical protein
LAPGLLVPFEAFEARDVRDLCERLDLLDALDSADPDSLFLDERRPGAAPGDRSSLCSAFIGGRSFKAGSAGMSFAKGTGTDAMSPTIVVARVTT